MIDLLASEDQQALADNFVAVLTAQAPLSRLRENHDADAELVRRLAALGWIGLGPELGLGAAEEILLMREAGRHLIGPRLAATMLAAQLADDPAFADGGAQAALCFGDLPGALRLDHCDGDACILLTPSHVVRIEAREAESERAVDDTIRLERIAAVAGNAGSAPLRQRATLWIAAILTGMAERARDMAVDYAKVREQFGQPIGAFQAIKHRCADMALGCEAAWTQTCFAALALDGARADAPFQVAAARLIAGDAALRNARANIQIHGGIGFTEECDAQLVLRRTHIWLAAGGAARAHQNILLAEPAP